MQDGVCNRDNEDVDFAVKHRLLSLGFYFGIAPFIGLVRRPGSPLTAHHYGQSLALFFVLLCIFLFAAGFYATGTILLLYFPEIYGDFPFDFVSMIIQLCVFSAWLLVWLICLVLAAVGSTWSVPVLSRIARRRWTARISTGWVLLFTTFILLIVVLGLYSTSLVADREAPGRVYMLYDDMGFIPRWVFSLGFMTVSRAANERWGRGSSVVAPLSREALRHAFQKGRLVFVACHGAEGFVYTPRDSNVWLAPEEVQSMEKGSDLQQVYLAGCDLGVRAPEWHAALSPAEIETFDRLSATAEHIRWLWLEGPERVAALK